MLFIYILMPKANPYRIQGSRKEKNIYYLRTVVEELLPYVIAALLLFSTGNGPKSKETL